MQRRRRGSVIWQRDLMGSRRAANCSCVKHLGDTVLENARYRVAHDQTTTAIGETGERRCYRGDPGALCRECPRTRRHYVAHSCRRTAGCAGARSVWAINAAGRVGRPRPRAATAIRSCRARGRAGASNPTGRTARSCSAGNHAGVARARGCTNRARVAHAVSVARLPRRPAHAA